MVEAQYGDFLDEHRLAGRWPAAHVARVLAEIAALHPRLPIIFAGSRKLANLWAERYFAACAADAGVAPQLELVPGTSSNGPITTQPRLDDQIRITALHELGATFTTADVAARYPEVPLSRVRRILVGLEQEHRLGRTGAKRGLRWVVGGAGHGER